MRSIIALSCFSLFGTNLCTNDLRTPSHGKKTIKKQTMYAYIYNTQNINKLCTFLSSNKLKTHRKYILKKHNKAKNVIYDRAIHYL